MFDLGRQTNTFAAVVSRHVMESIMRAAPLLNRRAYASSTTFKVVYSSKIKFILAQMNIIFLYYVYPVAIRSRKKNVFMLFVSNRRGNGPLFSTGSEQSANAVTSFLGTLLII